MSDSENIQTGRASGLDAGPIIGWARPLGVVPPAPYCGVVDLDLGGSVIVACRGRWSRAEHATHYIQGRDIERDLEGHRIKKCGGCERVAQQQRTEDGMRELAAVFPEMPLPTFDLSDTEDDEL